MKNYCQWLLTAQQQTMEALQPFSLITMPTDFCLSPPEEVEQNTFYVLHKKCLDNNIVNAEVKGIPFSQQAAKVFRGLHIFLELLSVFVIDR